MTTRETFHLRRLLLFFQVIVLLYTKSQAHEVVHYSLSPPFGQHSEQVSLVVMENITDIFLSDPSPIIGNACHSLHYRLRLIESVH